MTDESTSVPIGAVQIRQEVEIAALRDEVWAALTDGIDHWWVHRVTPFDESKMHLEAKAGGRFWEEWGEGDGAVWGTVTFLHDPELLRIEGALGANAGVHGTIEIELQPVGTEIEAPERVETTTLTLVHTMFGNFGPSEYGPMYEDGWRELWARLKAYVEEGEELEE